MSLSEILIKHQEESKKDNPWIGSKYEFIKNAGTDATGKIGEEFIYELLKKTFQNIDIIWEQDKNTNQNDGIYDIKMVSIPLSFFSRIEIKTATLGKSESYQHEKLLGKKYCDKILFLDINPNSYYITILDVNEIDFEGLEKGVLGKKLTIRTTGNQTKLDFSKKSIEIGLKLGKTIYIENENKNREEIINFLKKNLL